MSTYAQYPYAVLQSVGGTLTGISDDLSKSNRGAADVDGLSSDQSKINGAIDDFRGEWKESVRKLSASIGSFGDLSTQIGQLAGGLDQQLADAMKTKQ